MSIFHLVNVFTSKIYCSSWLFGGA